MARNKYPEQTEARILDAATKLFVERGYQGTSIQDIVDAAGGITRGAFYHHFGSKEDCFEAVAAKLFFDKAPSEGGGPVEGASGLEKIRCIVVRSVSNEMQQQVMRFAPGFFRSDKYILTQLYDSIEAMAPLMLPYIREGIADGSVRCRHPREAAEIVLLFFNIYLSPVMFRVSEDSYMRRLDQVGVMLRGAGIDIVNEQVARAAREFYRSVNAAG